MKPVLYGYFRSGTTWRVRAALNYKGVAYDYVPVNLVKGEQSQAGFKARNPQGLVPALEVEGATLTQSPAILEWIEETWPQPALLPGDPMLRAKVRAFCAAIGCDIHPIQNLRVLKKVKALTGAEEAGPDWARHWITLGFEALEEMVSPLDGAGGFLFGEGPSMAEIYLMPQMFNAERFGVDLEPFPKLVAANAAAQAVPEFAAAHPSRQPDAG
ncbi:maleylacetoacetate isomerase [Marinicauda algicola]|uniref:Maleylacetoacetate isomerase n=1 Tax=Marinicauda algicola TaxID=2029849 RepID=A0A4S2GWH4_9PROT|nr:maleylacetoacetate isomerase [Marinicauda algicola]TGY87238.1 maleylacetoacetate isomerase [Marinicauda algicola]